MATFTVHIPGPSEDGVEIRARLTSVGVAIGYGGWRSETAGRGAAGLMLRDIADGKATVLPAGNDGDFAWLAGALEKLIADNPDRAELLRSGIAACNAAEQLRARGPVGGVDRGGRVELTEG